MIATSGLLWELAATGATLYLPPMPPFSLTRSIAICAPIEEATDPPAARPGQVVDQADAHRFGLRLGACPIEAKCSGGTAEVFSSDLREVGIVSSPEPSFFRLAVVFLGQVF